MSKVPTVYLALMFLITAAYSCGSADEKRTAPGAEAGQGGDEAGVGGHETSEGGGGAAAQAGTGTDEVGGAAVSGAGGADAGSAGAEASGAGQAGSGPVVLPDGVIADVPYTCESPFEGVTFDAYFHLEDFEDGPVATPGVTASSSTLSSSFGGGLVDSIDCDDGAVDGICANCDALYGNGSIEVTFDAQALGELPTHVGMVWTDGGAGANVTITGYDATEGVIYTETVSGIGDQSIYGTVEEDRFFGIVHHDGIKRVLVVNSTGGVEIDHLQYGR